MHKSLSREGQGYQEGRTSLFSVVPNDRIRANGHRKFNFKIRQNTFLGVFCLFGFGVFLKSCEDGQTLDQAVQRSCGASILADNQNPNVQSPKQPVLVDPALSRGTGPETSRHPLQPQLFSDSMTGKDGSIKLEHGKETNNQKTTKS